MTMFEKWVLLEVEGGTPHFHYCESHDEAFEKMRLAMIDYGVPPEAFDDAAELLKGGTEHPVVADDYWNYTPDGGYVSDCADFVIEQVKLTDDDKRLIFEEVLYQYDRQDIENHLGEVLNTCKIDSNVAPYSDQWISELKKQMNEDPPILNLHLTRPISITKESYDAMVDEAVELFRKRYTSDAPEWEQRDDAVHEALCNYLRQFEAVAS